MRIRKKGRMKRRGGTCRCPMCGSKNACEMRNDYWRYGIRIDESGPNRSWKTRRQMRHILRQQLKRELYNETW